MGMEVLSNAGPFADYERASVAGFSNYEGALVAKYGLLEQTSTISVTSRV